MLYYSIWLAAVVVLGVVCMVLVVRRIGGGSAKYFVRQQQALGRTEGYIEEMMNGQKVVKVFCHEQEAKRAFDAINDALFSDAEKSQPLRQHAHAHSEQHRQCARMWWWRWPAEFCC